MANWLPENLNVFSPEALGYLSSGPWLLIPPAPFGSSSYSCGARFQLNELLEKYQTGEEYGLIGITGEEINYYLISLIGTHPRVEKLGSFKTELGTRHRKGGQSQRRHERNHDHQRKNFLTLGIERAFEHYFTKDRCRCRVLKLGLFGPGKNKDNWAKHPEFSHWFPLIGSYDSAEIDPESARRVFQEHQGDFQADPMALALQQIQEYLEREPDRLVFGIEEVTRNECRIIWGVEASLAGLPPQSEKTQVVELTSSFETHYGPIVGVRWYGSRIEEV